MTIRRTSLLLAAGAAAFGTPLVAGLDAGHGQAPPRSLTLTLPNSAPTAVLDGGRRGRSAGDVLLFARPLHEGGRRAGTFVGTLHATARRGRTSLAVATLDIRGRGSLSVQGALDLAARNQGTLAVVGGTGEFAGASGTVAVESGRRERVSFRASLSG